MNENTHEKLYSNPTCVGIRSNIHSQQSKLLLYLYDMAFVASNADSGFTITPPVKTAVTGKHSEEYEQQFEQSLKSFTQNFDKNIKLSHKLDRKVHAREFLFEEIWSIYPDFCKNMEHKIPPEDYELYKRNKKALSEAITVGSDSYISFDETLLAYQDRLSAVIDSEDFSKACNIEDDFVISEIDKFLEILQTLPREQAHHFQKKSVKTEGQEPLSIVDLAQKLKKERLDRKEKYSHIQTLYDKLRRHPYIKIDKPDYGDEEK